MVKVYVTIKPQVGCNEHSMAFSCPIILVSSTLDSHEGGVEIGAFSFLTWFTSFRGVLVTGWEA